MPTPERSNPHIACSDRTCTAVRFVYSGQESLVPVAGVQLEVAALVAEAGIEVEVLARVVGAGSVAVVGAETAELADAALGAG